MDDVFIPKETTDNDILVPFKRGIFHYYGDYQPDVIGLEIEIEGRNLIFPDREEYDEEYPEEPCEGPINKYWTFKVDHSLRGEENAEYILTEPLPFDKLEIALKSLWDLFAVNGTEIHESNRTSVHVHFNYRDRNVRQLASLLALYYPIEEILLEYSGEHRKGNLFCLSAADAAMIPIQMRDFIACPNRNTAPKDNHHYASLNCNALTTFGSLEFRSMAGTDNYQSILDWVSILKSLIERADKIRDPRDICEQYSLGGIDTFLPYALGHETAQKIIDSVGWTRSQVENCVKRGVRQSQAICYCRNWTAFKEATEEDFDPFGRLEMESMNVPTPQTI